MYYTHGEEEKRIDSYLDYCDYCGSYLETKIEYETGICNNCI